MFLAMPQMYLALKLAIKSVSALQLLKMSYYDGEDDDYFFD